MWFNQASCDIYMGSGAGTKLLKEIGNAQKSVKICSPYLSPKMIDKLVWLHQQGIEVALITSDTYDARNQKLEDSIRPLVVQHRHLDGKADGNRKAWRIAQNSISLFFNF